MKCLFCGEAASSIKTKHVRYDCSICGGVDLTEEAAEDFAGERFSDDEKKTISCVLRNDYEKRGRKHPVDPLKIDDLRQLVEGYVSLTPLEKLDNALIRLGVMSRKVGDEITVTIARDYPLFHCFDDNECHKVLRFLLLQDLIEWRPVMGGPQSISLNHNGYKRLQELQRTAANSSSCFVAMWFDETMKKVYNEAIKPAIEFFEEGKKRPKFKAIKIDNVEHINDINDEIIANIRRSRFMVCDLTGYRGGDNLGDGYENSTFYRFFRREKRA